MRIAINGSGIAGPTLAYWLRRSGHEVVLVEQAAQLRSGGYMIDFWGVGYTIAEKMGLIAAIRDAGYQVREVRFVDRDGRTAGGFSTDVLVRMTKGRFTSLRRSDLAAIIYRGLGNTVETLFGDSVAAIAETSAGVRVSFAHAAPRDFDLVIGADGLHSRVRQLAFGADAAVEIKLGYYVAAFEIDGYRPRDELVYVSHAVAGRQIARFSMREDKTLVLCVFDAAHLPDGEPAGRQEVQTLLARVFAGMGWETPQLLARVADAAEIYFDRVSQIRLPQWSRGRVALLGDAAACVSLLAGEGTGLAMAEAYVLAGELHRAGGDHAVAFARYQERLQSFLQGKQRSAAQFASSFAPATDFGVTVRNLVTRLFRIPRVADLFIGRSIRDDFALPDDIL